jgi:hypothetical protein
MPRSTELTASSVDDDRRLASVATFLPLLCDIVRLDAIPLSRSHQCEVVTCADQEYPSLYLHVF